MEATEEQGEWNGRSESGNSIWAWFGLDVSKESFTAARFQGVTKETFWPKDKTFPLDKEGVAGFLKWRNLFDNSILTDAVAMEATGAYTGKLCRLLLAADPDLRVSVCNPLSVSLYARSHTATKTDGTDAVYFAMFACDHQPREWRMSDGDQAHFRDIENERNKLVELRTALSNLGGTIEFKDVAKINKEMIKEVDERLDRIEAIMREIVKSRWDIADEIALLDTVPRIGFTSAVAIYAMLGSLKQYTRKEGALRPVGRVPGQRAILQIVEKEQNRQEGTVPSEADPLLRQQVGDQDTFRKGSQGQARRAGELQQDEKPLRMHAQDASRLPGRCRLRQAIRQGLQAGGMAFSIK